MNLLTQKMFVLSMSKCCIEMLKEGASKKDFLDVAGKVFDSMSKHDIKDAEKAVMMGMLDNLENLIGKE